MVTIADVIKSHQLQPSKFEAEEAIERIVFLEKIRNGLQQSDADKVVSKEQAKKRLKKWLK